MPTKKILTIIGIALAVLLVLGGILLYYQEQGVLKVFPSAEERRIRKILTIDRSKFAPPEGMRPEQFEEEIRKLDFERRRTEANPKNAQAWFQFGYHKALLNDHVGAVAAWEKSFELQELNFVTATNLGEKYQYFLKNYPKAEHYYRKALEVRPDFTTAYKGLLDLYRFNFEGRQDKVEPLALEAARKDSVNAVAYYSDLVDFFVRQKNDVAKAREYLVKIQQLNKKAADNLLQSFPALR